MWPDPYPSKHSFFFEEEGGSYSKGGFYPSRDSHIETNNVFSLDFHKLAVPVAYQNIRLNFLSILAKVSVYK